MALTIQPASLREANAYVEARHRHHKRSQGHKFSIACVDAEGAVRGVVIVGRPVARLLQDGKTLEVVRLCTDGAANACSLLYGAARRAAKELGYSKIITYTLKDEAGASLRAAGWTLDGPAGGGSWSRPSSGRLRTDKHPTEAKQRWSASLRKPS